MVKDRRSIIRRALKCTAAKLTSTKGRLETRRSVYPVDFASAIRPGRYVARLNTNHLSMGRVRIAIRTPNSVLDDYVEADLELYTAHIMLH
jgi:hypothetical protein